VIIGNIGSNSHEMLDDDDDDEAGACARLTRVSTSLSPGTCFSPMTLIMSSRRPTLSLSR